MVWCCGIWGTTRPTQTPNSMKWLENTQIKWQQKRNLITTSTSLSVSYDINPTLTLSNTTITGRFSFWATSHGPLLDLNPNLPPFNPRNFLWAAPNLKAIRSRASPNPKGKIQNSLLPRPVWFTSFLIQHSGEVNCWTMKVWWSIFSWRLGWLQNHLQKYTHIYQIKNVAFTDPEASFQDAFQQRILGSLVEKQKRQKSQGETPSDHSDHPQSQPPEPSALDLPPGGGKLGSLTNQVSSRNAGMGDEFMKFLWMYLCTYMIYIYICTYSCIYIWYIYIYVCVAIVCRYCISRTT